MFESITLDDSAGSPVTLHRTSTRAVNKAEGLVTISAVRSVVRVRPTAHGGIDQSRWTDAAIVVLNGYVTGPDPLSELAAIQRPMLETLDVGPALLRWEESASGLLKQKRVKLADAVQAVTDASSPTVIRWQAQLRASDPRSYSQQQVTATGGTLQGAGGDVFEATGDVFESAGDAFSQSAGATAAINNQGDRPTPALLRIFGYCVNPEVLLVDTGERIALQGVIAPGDFVELDTHERSVRLNGTSSALRFVDAARTTWFQLPPGTSTVRLLAGSNDAVARCDVLYHHAYI